MPRQIPFLNIMENYFLFFFFFQNLSAGIAFFSCMQAELFNTEIEESG